MHCVVCKCFYSHNIVVNFKTNTKYYKILSAPLSFTVVAIKPAGLNHIFALLVVSDKRYEKRLRIIEQLS